jgi:hypothetical protein
MKQPAKLFPWFLPAIKFIISIFYYFYEKNINDTKNNSVFVDIFSSAGKHIYSKELLMETNSIYHKINLSGQPNGVYHIKISERANFITKSIVIH